MCNVQIGVAYFAPATPASFAKVFLVTFWDNSISLSLPVEKNVFSFVRRMFRIHKTTEQRKNTIENHDNKQRENE